MSFIQQKGTDLTAAGRLSLTQRPTASRLHTDERTTMKFKQTAERDLFADNCLLMNPTVHTVCSNSYSSTALRAL